MYIVIESLRIILKKYTISINLYNLFLKKVVYILNILINRLTFDEITSFKAVNEAFLNVSHLRTLDCKVYMHVSKLVLIVKE